MGLRVDRLHSGGTLHRTKCTTRRDIACDLPRSCPHVLWHLGKFVVCVQSSSHGMVGIFFGRVTRRLTDSVFSIWYGVQASIGGTCVKVMLRAIWPSINNIRQSSRP